MRIAALYDIHGNVPALEAVLDEVRAAEVDLVVVGGDVLPGPMPREALAMLRALDIPTRCIRGNGDRVVLECLQGIESPEVPASVREVVRWNAAQLHEDDRAWLAQWPASLRLTLPSLGRVLFCHATPRSDTETVTRLTSDDRFRARFEDAQAELVVAGHTHMQFDRTIDSPSGPVRVVNAGSVGMPFGVPGAYWLLLGDSVELRRTGYDLSRAVARVRATSYPQASEFAERSILEPPSEAAMLALLSGEGERGTIEEEGRTAEG